MAEPTSRIAAYARTAADSILHSYSLVWFSNRRVSGICFLAATCTVPSEGLYGLLSVITANLCALGLGFDRGQIRAGNFGFNALLVGLGLCYCLGASPAIAPFIVVAAVATVLVTAALEWVTVRVCGLPVLSLGFVSVTLVAGLAALRLHASSYVAHPLPWPALDGLALPGGVRLFLVSLSAIFFKLDVLSGIFVLLGLAIASRISLVLSAIGFVAGIGCYRAMGGSTTDSTLGLLGFNFIMAAIAVGGMFAVPSAASYVAAAIAAALAALAGVGVHELLQPLGMPVLSIPFIIAVYIVLLAARSRMANKQPEVLAVPQPSPEENLALAQSRRLRMADGSGGGMRLPFSGAWRVSQGINGPHTHRDQWRYALDFVVAGDDGRTFSGDPRQLSSFLANGIPVLAPASGVVAKIVDGLPDNAIGEFDTEQNWGNYISIALSDGTFALLAHMRQGSFKVKTGQPVVAGEVIAACGNSGRSPEPHIHFHVQRKAEPGGETLPFTILRYIQRGSQTQLIERAVPGEGNIVENTVPSDSRRRAVRFVPGERHYFRVRANGADYEETLVAGIDLAGVSFLRSERDDGRLHYQLQDDVFVATFMSAKPRSLLNALFIAGARIPLVDEPRLVWTERVPIGPFLRGLARIAAEVALPLMPNFSVLVAQRFSPVHGRRGGGFFCVAGEARIAFAACRNAYIATAVFHELWGLMQVTVDNSKGVRLLEAERLVA